MLRLSFLALLIGTIWLAHTAIPDAEAQRRMDRIIGISLSGMPGTQAVNRTEAPAKADTLATEMTTRSAAQVFGSRTAVRWKARPQRAATLHRKIPSPTRKPRQQIQRSAAVQIVERTTEPAKGATAPQTIEFGQVTLVSDPVLDTLPSPEPIEQIIQQAPRLSKRERRRVARNIQRELKRVGCYHGAADGIWGRQTRNAMKAFSASTATPVSHAEPDYVALMLVEMYDARACRSPDRTPVEHAPATEIAETDTINDRAIRRVVAEQSVPAEYISRNAVPALPTAKPRRYLANAVIETSRRRIARVSTRVSRSGEKAVRPRVAGSTTRKVEVAALTENQTTASTHASSRSASTASQRSKANKRASLKRRQLQVATARKRAKQRRLVKLRAKRKARRLAARTQRRARKRASRKKPTYGFRRARRAWVRHAFQHKS